MKEGRTYLIKHKRLGISRLPNIRNMLPYCFEQGTFKKQYLSNYETYSEFDHLRSANYIEQKSTLTKLYDSDYTYTEKGALLFSQIANHFIEEFCLPEDTVGIIENFVFGPSIGPHRYPKRTVKVT
jgi:hypothetical protein